MPEFPKLQDITQPPHPPEPWEVFLDPSRPMFWLIYGGLILFCLGVVLILWSRSRSGKKSPPQLPLTPQTEAMRRLSDMEALAATLSPLELGNGVSDILRHFLHRTEGVLATYRTTDEIVGHLDPANGNWPPPLPHLLPYAPLLRRCDALKYGGAGTSPADRAALVREAMDCVSGKAVAAAPPSPSPSMPAIAPALPQTEPAPEASVPAAPLVPQAATVPEAAPPEAMASPSAPPDLPPAALETALPEPEAPHPAENRPLEPAVTVVSPATSLPFRATSPPPPVILAGTSVIPY